MDRGRRDGDNQPFARHADGRLFRYFAGPTLGCKTISKRDGRLMDLNQILYLFLGPVGMFLTGLIAYFLFGREETGRR